MKITYKKRVYPVSKPPESFLLSWQVWPIIEESSAAIFFQYSLQEIFFIALTGVLCGCDSWESIAMFGKVKVEWFRKYFPYKKRTPSADTLERFFGKLNTSTFGECFIKWASQMFTNVENEVINIDRKRLCGSYDTYCKQAALHVVSAYASANQLSLGQVLSDQKSNEIKAILTIYWR